MYPTTCRKRLSNQWLLNDIPAEMSSFIAVKAHVDYSQVTKGHNYYMLMRCCKKPFLSESASGVLLETCSHVYSILLNVHLLILMSDSFTRLCLAETFHVIGLETVCGHVQLWLTAGHSSLK